MESETAVDVLLLFVSGDRRFWFLHMKLLNVVHVLGLLPKLLIE